MPIGQITQITDIQSQKVTDEHKNKDIKYKEDNIQDSKW